MRTFNLILSGGGIKSYTHLGVYKYCFERGVKFSEIVGVSGGAVMAPLMYLERQPDSLIYLFKKAKLHKKLFPFWFMPHKFEFLFTQPSTIKLGRWLEEQLTQAELNKVQNTTRLHIMATQESNNGGEHPYVNMLRIARLKDAVASSSAISGLFKAHKVGKDHFVDGSHWSNVPIFFNFKNPGLPVLAVNLNYYAPFDESKRRISKIFEGRELSSYARFEEDVKRWDSEKREDLHLVTPPLQNIDPLKLDITDKEFDELIDIGYNAAKDALKPTVKKELLLA